ncbi:MAG TPA: hypothetical protein VGT41_06275 [Candidatus Babeliales bacterium]|nr:hypothetical protein [Candidatus Babeliales bacterium]
MKKQFLYVAVVMGLIGSSQHVIAAYLGKEAITNFNDAQKNLEAASEVVWDKGGDKENMLTSIGSTSYTVYQRNKKHWYNVLNEMANYIKKTDNSLMPDFIEIENISKRLYLDRTDVYARYIKKFVISRDQEGGVMNIDANSKSIDFAKIDIKSIEGRVGSFISAFKKIEPLKKKLADKLQKYKDSNSILNNTKKKQEAVQAVIYLYNLVAKHAQEFNKDFVNLRKICEAKNPKTTTIKK